MASTTLVEKLNLHFYVVYIYIFYYCIDMFELFLYFLLLELLYCYALRRFL